MAKAKKLPSGNWNVLLYVGKDENGKRRYKSVTAPTKKEAEFKAASYAINKNEGARMPLRTAAEKYVEIKSAVLSPSTIRSYRGIIDNDLGTLGNVSVHDITTADVQSQINRLARDHSPKTVRNVSAFISAVLKMYRPTFQYPVSLPPKIKKEVYIPDKDVIARLAAKAKGRRIELPFLLASRLGLRASEIAGLTYGAIKNKTLTVRQAMVRGPEGQVVKTPKSYAGYRTLPCPDDILALIGEGSPSEYVTGMTQSAITDAWTRFIISSGEEFFSFHKLRHYFASRAMLAGVPQRYIMELMGHASPDMLNKIYQHTFASEKEEFARRIIEF